MVHSLPGVAFITGAGSGIGKACVKKFAEAGCKHLVLVDQNADGLALSVKEAGLEESRVTTVAVDIRDRQALKDLISSIPEKWGSLDYALNLAGIGGKGGGIHKHSEEDIDLMLDINLKSQVILNQYQAEAMLVSRKNADPNAPTSAIVNAGSVVGIKPNYLIPIYSIAKAGMIALTKVMATNYGSKGIRTNAIAPGLIETPMTTQLDKEGKIKDATPLKRAGKPEEVADLVAFLCSTQSSFMNGEAIILDGGHITAL